MNDFNDFMKRFAKWAEDQPLIRGVAIVGSYARGDYKEDSDVDIVIITDEKELTLRALENEFTFDKLEQAHREEWGILTSWRVYYTCGLEVEYGVVGEQWVAEPLDLGTVNVVTNGFRIVIDKENVFGNIVSKLNNP